MATTSNGLVWIVEHQPDVADLLQQAVRALGHETRVTSTAGEVLAAAAQSPPALLIADLHLPGLSGKDLLVALRSQEVEVPVIVVASAGEQDDLIQAFRLGAEDYLLWPVREAEVVAAVERVLERSRARQERDALVRQVREANDALQRRVRDLQTISALGKAVVSITDQKALFEKIVAGALHISRSDVAWLLLSVPKQSVWLLAAHQGLPAPYAARLHRPWNDGVSPPVAASGKPVVFSGPALKRYPLLEQMGQAAAVVPVRTSKDVAGVLTVARRAAQPYTPHEQAMLAAVADYAAIALTNARMMRVLEERARRLQHMATRVQIDEQIKSALLSNASMVLREPLNSALGYADMLAEEQLGGLNAEQTQAMEVIRQKLQITTQVAEYLTALSEQEKLAGKKEAILQRAVRQVIPRLEFVARQRRVGLGPVPEDGADKVAFNPAQLERVIEAMLVHALGFARPGSTIDIAITRGADRSLQLRVHSRPQELTAAQRKRLLHLETQGLLRSQNRFSGVSIGLSLAKRVAELHGAVLSAHTQSAEEIDFLLRFPLTQ